MFDRLHSKDKGKDAAAGNEPHGSSPLSAPRDPQAPKGRPTPTRKEREEARKRPLVQQDRKGGGTGRTARGQRAHAREQMLAGNEKYLAERDRGPSRRFLRDWVDARWNVGEFFLPVMLIILLITLVKTPWTQMVLFVVVYGLIGLVILDSWWSWHGAKKAHRAKFGADPARGSMFYVIMRGMQIRRMRMPLPQVRRGAKIG